MESFEVQSVVCIRKQTWIWLTNEFIERKIFHILIGTMEPLNMHKNMPNHDRMWAANAARTLCGILMKRENSVRYSLAKYSSFHLQKPTKKSFRMNNKTLRPFHPFTVASISVEFHIVPYFLCHVRQNWNEISNREFYPVIICTLRLNHWAKNAAERFRCCSQFASMYIGYNCKVWLQIRLSIGTINFANFVPHRRLFRSSLSSVRVQRSALSGGQAAGRLCSDLFLRWFYCFIFVCEQNNTGFMLCFNTTREDRLIAAQQ